MQDITSLVKSADFLNQYGFLAAALFFILVICPFFLITVKSKSLSMLSAVIGVLFLIAWTTRDAIRTTFPNLLPASIVLVGGEVNQLDASFTVIVRSDLLNDRVAYIRREYDRNDRDKVNFKFFFVLADNQLPKCLAIELRRLSNEAPGAPQAWLDNLAGEPSIFNVQPIVDKEIRDGVRFVIQFEESKGRLAGQLRKHSGQGPVGDPVPIAQLSQNERACGRSTLAAWQPSEFFGIGFVSHAWAQGQNSSTKPADDIAARLQSSDALIRRDARIDLSLQGVAGFNTISQLLKSNNYRLQLGAVAALAAMTPETRRQAPETLKQEVSKLLVHPDRTMRETALHALDSPAFCYQERDTRKSPVERYLAICYFNAEQCERIRGPNRATGVAQTDCQRVDLQRAAWRHSLGVESGWYEFSGEPFPAPFPQLPPP